MVYNRLIGIFLLFLIVISLDGEFNSISENMSHCRFQKSESDLESRGGSANLFFMGFHGANPGYY